MLELEVEAGARPGRTGAARPAHAEEPRVRLGGRTCPRPIAGQEPPRDLAVATARERDDPFRLVGQERLRDPRHRLRPGEVGPADQPAEAPVAGVVAGQQDEVRAALVVTHAAQVLAHRLAVAGQPAPFRVGPLGTATVRAVASVAITFQPVPARTLAGRAASRHDDAGGIRHDRVAQDELDADDRADPRLERRRGEAHRAVEPVVVGHRQRRHAQLRRSLDERFDR